MEVNDLRIEWIGHSGFLIDIKNTGKKIIIDPYKISNKVPKANIILITHEHQDHCSIEDIEKIVEKGSIVVCPAAVQSKIAKLNDIEVQIIEIGDRLNFGLLEIEGFPAYNPDKKFHPKEEGFLGYLIKYKNVVIYHAGDTDKIPEMEKLTGYAKHGNQFVALLPVSGKYVMDAYEAGEVAKMLNADIVIPMHYGSGIGTKEDAVRFAEICRKSNIPVRVLEKI